MVSAIGFQRVTPYAASTVLVDDDLIEFMPPE